MKRIFRSTSSKFVLCLGLLLIASAWSAATWSRSQRATQLSDNVRQTSDGSTAQPDAATKARLNEAYGQLPLSFQANVGQTDPHVDFISRGNGYTLFLTPREAVLTLRAASSTKGDGRSDGESALLRMKFVGSETRPRAEGQEELPGKINYLVGKDPRRWRTGVSTYARVA